MLTASKICTLITNLRWNDSLMSETTVKRVNDRKETSLGQGGLSVTDVVSEVWLRVSDPKIFAFHLIFNYDKNQKLKDINVAAFLGEESPSDFVHLNKIVKGKNQIFKTLVEKNQSELSKLRKRESAKNSKRNKLAIKAISQYVASI